MERTRAEQETEIREDSRDIDIRENRRKFHQNAQQNPFYTHPNKKIPLDKFNELFTSASSACEKRCQ